MFHLNKNKKQFIPNGEWEGFYNYPSKRGEHKMNCLFNFENGLIKGCGNDDVGNYSWCGEYDKDLNIFMIKIYSKHIVHYTGYADENGIWGNWQIIKLSGGFHLWPKQINSNATQAEEQQASVLSALKIIHS